MVGKYTNLSDAYLSVIKSLQHACLAANRKLEILWVEASHLEDQTETDDNDAFHVRLPKLSRSSITWFIILLLASFITRFWMSCCRFAILSPQ